MKKYPFWATNSPSFNQDIPCLRESQSPHHVAEESTAMFS